ncbi:hypothetical protein FRC09_017437 [Ceratobasidium sp. 395]|nr:hypothetical protein FRC09_017437 [Ceratobasidium sp. 395]
MWTAARLPEGDPQLVLGATPSLTNLSGTVGLNYSGVTSVRQRERHTARSRPLELIPFVVVRRFFHPALSSSTTNILRSNIRMRAGEFSERVVLLRRLLANANVGLSVEGGEGEVIDTSTPVIVLETSQNAWWSKRGLSAGEHAVKIAHVGRNTDDPSLKSASHELSETMIGTIIGAVVGGVISRFDLVVFSVLFRRKRALKETHEVGKPDIADGAASKEGI